MYSLSFNKPKLRTDFVPSIVEWSKNLLPPPNSHCEEQVNVIGKDDESREVLSSFEIAVWGGRTHVWVKMRRHSRSP